MTRTVILVSTDEKDSINYYPYISWAWNQLGWDTLLFYCGKHSVLLDVYKKVKLHFENSRNQVILLPEIEGHSKYSVAYAAQYFGGACISDNRMLMTAPINMMPVKNHWTPAEGKVSGYIHEDIGIQIAMSAPEWRTIMGISDKMGLDMELKKHLDTNKGKEPFPHQLRGRLETVKTDWVPLEAKVMFSSFIEAEICQHLLINFKKLPGWCTPQEV